MLPAAARWVTIGNAIFPDRSNAYVGRVGEYAGRSLLCQLNPAHVENFLIVRDPQLVCKKAVPPL